MYSAQVFCQSTVLPTFLPYAHFASRMPIVFFLCSSLAMVVILLSLLKSHHSSTDYWTWIWPQFGFCTPSYDSSFGCGYHEEYSLSYQMLISKVHVSCVLLSTLAFTAFELPPNGAVGTRILEFLFHSRPDLANIQIVDEAVVIGAALPLSSSAFVLQQACQVLVGHYDFSSFRAAACQGLCLINSAS